MYIDILYMKRFKSTIFPKHISYIVGIAHNLIKRYESFGVK